MNDALEQNGMSKVMTQARRDGTIKKPPVELVNKQYQQNIVMLLKDHLRMGKVIQPEEAYRFQKEIKDLSFLKGEPQLIRALFIESNVPSELKEELIHSPPRDFNPNLSPGPQAQESTGRRKRRVIDSIPEESKLDYQSSHRPNPPANLDFADSIEVEVQEQPEDAEDSDHELGEAKPKKQIQTQKTPH